MGSSVAICLFNIVAAASVAGIKDFKIILRNNLTPTLISGLLIGIVGLLLIRLNN